MENFPSGIFDRLDMVRELRRLNSFSEEWPHTEGNLTPAKMANAGFFSTGEEDNVQCFVCFKELDGWEDEDDPWKEHKSHSKNCPFIKLGKLEQEMTVKEWLNLEKKTMKAILTKARQDVLAEFKNEVNKEKAAVKKAVKKATNNK